MWEKATYAYANETYQVQEMLEWRFSVGIKYEYPDTQELEELEIPEIDNVFTWIWITLECNKCGTRYKDFVDCETT